MKNYAFALLGIVLLFGCSKPDCPDPGKDHEDVSNYISPRFSFSASNVPFSGVLEVYPTKSETSLYYGNFSQAGQHLPFPAYYVIKEGDIFQSNRALLLPEGNYNLIYWGTSNETQYADPQVGDPSLTLISDLSTSYFSLRPITSGGSVYSSTFAFVYAKKELNVGVDSIHVDLSRAVASLVVNVENDDATPLDPLITSVQVLLSGVYKQLNVYSGGAVGDLVTVQIPLVFSSDRSKASNLPAMIFPTIQNPPIEVVVTFSDGTTVTRKAELTNTLSAGVKLTLNVKLAKLLSPSGEQQGFQLNPWKNEDEQINF